MKQQQTIKPFVLGLTGSIASGKTAALEAFKQCGVFTLSADVLTHQVLGLASVQKKLQKTFGVTSPEALAKLVFNNASARKRLEEIPLAVFEVPLLFEAGWDKYADMTLLIVSSGAGLAARLKQRGLTLAQYQARLKTQLPQETKAQRADLIIVNNSTKQHLEQKVRRLARALNNIYG